MLTVKLLREYLRCYPDDSPILVPGYDHSFRDPRVGVRYVAEEGYRKWGETYPESTDPQVLAVILT
jgi:hypothetical protein